MIVPSYRNLYNLLRKHLGVAEESYFIRFNLITQFIGGNFEFRPAVGNSVPLHGTFTPRKGFCFNQPLFCSI